MGFEVITGDCVEVMRRMDADTFDLCVTSPPYDNLRQYKGYSFDFEATAKELYRVIKPGGVVVWVVGDATINGSETGTSFRQALYFKDVCGFNLHDTMIANKYLPGNFGKRYCQAFDFMFVMSKGVPRAWNPLTQPNKKAGQVQMSSQRSGGSTKNGHVVQGERTYVVREQGVRENVWRYSIGNADSSDRTGHPAPFPEALARDHILSWSNEGGLVLDPFCGSGTTGKMAVIAKRNFVGIEISPEYAALSEARIKRASGEWAAIPRLNRKPPTHAPLFDLASENL